jgi:hypothetical protein
MPGMHETVASYTYPPAVVDDDVWLLQSSYAVSIWMSFVYMHARSISLSVRVHDFMVLLFIALHMQPYTAGHHCIPAL